MSEWTKENIATEIARRTLKQSSFDDIKQYQQQDIMQQMQWYEAEEIYTDKLMADPLGDYISVRSNLQMERMIQQQYE